MIRVIYVNSSAIVSTSAVLSSPFAIQHGLRQCCPANPLPFVLSLEPLVKKYMGKLSIIAHQIVTFSGVEKGKKTCFPIDANLILKITLNDNICNLPSKDHVNLQLS